MLRGIFQQGNFLKYLYIKVVMKNILIVELFDEALKPIDKLISVRIGLDVELLLKIGGIGRKR